MRKPIVFVLGAVAVVLAVATVVLYQRYQVTSANYHDSKVAAETAQIQYTEVLSAIGEIQDSLNAVQLGDTSMEPLSKEIRNGERPSAPDRQQALQRISLLSASIQRAKAKINDLEASLSHSKTKVAGLQKLVANLKQTVAEREERLTALSAQVDTLQVRVTGLTAEVQSDQDTIRVKDQTIEDKRRELGTIYYIVGTKKDLTTQGVITAKGGVLGMGKTLTMVGRADDGLFTPLDTDAETTVHTTAAKVEVVSPQPAQSYELRQVGGQVELHILDPIAFRKVKHLVIMTKA